jgi:type I restriction enzyme S subunit
MSTNLIRLRLDHNVFLPDLLCRIFNGSRLVECHKDSECRGSSRTFFTQKILLRLRVPVPPLSEQRQILAKLKELQRQVDALQRLQAETSTELDALTPSILDRAFKGDL